MVPADPAARIASAMTREACAETARYAVIDIGGNAVLGIVDAAGPEEACQAVDHQRGEHCRGYASYGAQSGMDRCGRPGAFVHALPAGFTLRATTPADAVHAVRRHPCVAIVLTSDIRDIPPRPDRPAANTCTASNPRMNSDA
jgi:hypothetical protein